VFAGSSAWGRRVGPCCELSRVRQVVLLLWQQGRFGCWLCHGAGSHPRGYQQRCLCGDSWWGWGPGGFFRLAPGKRVSLCKRCWDERQHGTAGEGAAHLHPPAKGMASSCPPLVPCAERKTGLIWLLFEQGGRVPCKQGMWHAAAPCAGGVASCAPPARESPSRAFSGICCSCTCVPASNTQNLPPAGCLLPKGQGAGARAGCCLLGWLPTGPSLPGIVAGAKINPFLGNPPTWLQGGSCSWWPCAGTCSTPVCEDRQCFGDAGNTGLSPSNAVHPCASGAIPLAIWRALVAGNTSWGEVLDGQR